MQAVELRAELREGSGKGMARDLRRAGRFPAVFYGPRRDTVTIEIDSREFRLKISSLEGSHLVRLMSSSSDLNDKMVLVKETQHHPVTGAVLHADLYEVDMAVSIRVPVPLHFTGKPEGVVLGGILQPVRREIEVECLPKDIPEFIEVDVTPLSIHDALHVSDVILPTGVVAIYDTDFAIVTVVAPTVEEVAPAAEAEAAAVPTEGEPAKPEGEEAKAKEA